MVTKRRFREEGHRRKFLAVVDGTPESSRAVHYAARRAGAIGNGLELVCVVAPGDFGHWLGVEEIMRADARAAAEEQLEAAVALARSCCEVAVTTSIREGERAAEVVKLIEEDRDIAIMVLAAGDGKDGPGPLVSSVTQRAAFPIPVTIVPHALSDEEIDDLV